MGVSAVTGCVRFLRTNFAGSTEETENFHGLTFSARPLKCYRVLRLSVNSPPTVVFA